MKLPDEIVIRIPIPDIETRERIAMGVPLLGLFATFIAMYLYRAAQL